MSRFRCFGRLCRVGVLGSLVLIAVAGLAACGGGSRHGVVARVGQSAISTAALTHWMATMLGGDYYKITSQRAPLGFVSEPADFPACLAKLEAIAPVGGARPSAAVLVEKCQQLHRGVQEQAERFLLYAQVELGLAAEQGVTVTNGEIDQRLMLADSKEIAAEGGLRAYLAKRRWSLSDERFIIKLDLIQEKLSHMFTARKASAQAIARVNAKWVGATICYPGYIIYRCSEYKGVDRAPGPAPAALIQEIGRWQPATSHGFNKGTSAPSRGA